MAADTTGSAGRLEQERLIVERIRTCPEAFGELYDLYRARLHSYAYSRTGSAQDAEDIVSETFIRAFESIGQYEWRNVPFGAWLFRIASNEVAVHYRRVRPSVSIYDVVVADAAVGPEVEVVRAAEAQDLRQAVSTLKLDQQQALKLRYDAGLRHREIAGRMGRSEGAIKLLIHRATNALRVEMAPLSV